MDMFKFRKLDFVLTTRSRTKKYRIRGNFTLNNSNKKERHKYHGNTTNLKNLLKCTHSVL